MTMALARIAQATGYELNQIELVKDTIARTLPTLDDWYFGPLDMDEWDVYRGSGALKTRLIASLSWLKTY